MDLQLDEACCIHLLPQDTLHQIFSHLPLREIIICRSVCKFFYQTLTCPSFLYRISLRSPLNLVALRPSHSRHSSSPTQIHVFDPIQKRWLIFSLDFLPFRSISPLTSSMGLVYLWADSSNPTDSNSVKSLILCNPLTRKFRTLPHLGSAWSRHGTVLASDNGEVLVLTELAALYFSGSGSWITFSSNLPSKPRSPTLVSDSVYSLCDVGSPWRSQWKLFSCKISELGRIPSWNRIEKHEWGDVFDILKRPRLLQGNGNRILMVGGLKSSFSLNASYSTILILRLDLDTMEWEEAGRMPTEMFESFYASNKFKVFGGGDRVCFSAKGLRRLAIWDCSEEGKGAWGWIDGVPCSGDGLFRGFLFDARFTDLP